MKKTKKAEERWIGWHILENGKSLGYGDGRKPRCGQWLEVKNKRRVIGKCVYGMHACRRLADLPFWLFRCDSTIAIVELRQPVLYPYGMKSVSRARRPLTRKMNCDDLNDELVEALQRKMGRKVRFRTSYILVRTAQHCYVWSVRWIAKRLGWKGTVDEAGILIPPTKRGRA